MNLVPQQFDQVLEKNISIIYSYPKNVELIIYGCIHKKYNVICNLFFFKNPIIGWIYGIVSNLNLTKKINLNNTINEKTNNGELFEPNKKYRFRITIN